MCAYQFIHVDKFSSVQKLARARNGAVKGGLVKWSASDVLNEACREGGACAHVKSPQVPKWIIGSRETVEEAGREWLAVTKVGARRVRRDASWLAAGVISLQDERRDDWPALREASIVWLKNKFGERLRGVVEHQDERHRHVHFYAVPLPHESFGVVHDGYRGKVAAQSVGDRRVGRAYSNAMRELQTRFFEDVACKFGLERSGRNRLRQDRAEWKSRQAEVEFEATQARVSRLRQEYKEQEAYAATMKRDAKIAAKKLIADAQAEAEEISYRTKQRIEEEEARIREMARNVDRRRLELEEDQQAWNNSDQMKAVFDFQAKWEKMQEFWKNGRLSEAGKLYVELSASPVRKIGKRPGG